MVCCCVRRLLAVVFALSTLSSLAAQAQPDGRVSGSVIDEAGAALPGARVAVIDAHGAVAAATVTGSAGAFVVDGLPPGKYTLTVDLPLFVPATAQVAVTVGSPSVSLQIVLRTGGYSEEVVVSARRVESRLAETPQRVDIIDAVDIERTVATDLTDVLKKNAGVDVIQYSGALSGIGIRGVRPQFSGINKRTLLLIDGRPSGVTNLATLQLDSVERIEVLKGAASAVYGSSAMGGVVNVISRQSRGPLTGNLRLGGGSFGTSDIGGRVGGSLTRRFDFDASGTLLDQRDDFRMGNGVVRPATGYKTFDGAVRVGADVGRWRLDVRGLGYRGRDIMTPGDLATGVTSQGSKDLERSSQDIRLGGTLGTHALTITGYHADDSSHTTNVTSGNPADAPFLPYLSFESDLGWTGAQLRDVWNWSARGSLVAGFDYERVTSVSRSYARTGERTAPFSADSRKRTAGVYGEHTLKWRQGRTVVTAGGRFDYIENETVDTPLKSNFVPSQSSFAVFNPSIGFKHALVGALRVHGTLGRAFVPADAIQLTGYTTTTVGGRTQISQGNPDLKPERSTSFDAGAEWVSRRTRFDVTLFRTAIRDRFVSNVVVSNPAPPEPIVLSVVNGLSADMSGLEVEAEQRLGSRVGLFVNATSYFSRKERLAGDLEQDILNVPSHSIRAGADLDVGRVSARVTTRVVFGRKDNDFNQPGFPIVDYDTLAVTDVNATYRLARQHAIVVTVNNLFDAFYYEKIGFPLAGASFKAFYRLGF